MSGFLGLTPLGTLLDEADAPIDWVVSDVIARGGVTFLAARPGAGKTLIAFHVAACVLTGMPLLGEIAVARGAVAYLDLDMHRRAIAAMRATAALRGLGIEDEAIGALPLHIAADHSSIDLRNPKTLGEVIVDLREVPNLALVVVDTFSDTHHGKEQAPEEMTIVARALAEIATECACGVLVNHHVRKNGGDELEDVRGATSITAKADAVFMLKTERDRDGNPGTLTLLQRKARLTEEAKSRKIALVPEGEPRGKMTAYTYRIVGGENVGGRPPTEAAKAAAIIERETKKNPAIVKGELVKALVAGGITQTTAYRIAGERYFQKPDNPPVAEVSGNGISPDTLEETDSRDGYDADGIGNTDDAFLAVMDAWDVLINWARESSPFSEAERDAARMVGFNVAEAERLTDTVSRIYEEHRRWRAEA